MNTKVSNNITLHILQHLIENPEGMDTFEGIARFWVLRQEIRIQIGDVESAISSLLQEGYLVRVTSDKKKGSLPGFCYQINPEKLNDIHDLINKKASRG